METDELNDEQAFSTKFELRVHWQDTDLTVLLADQVLLQWQGDYLVLSLGQTQLPTITSFDDPRRAALVDAGVVNCKVLARFALPAKSARETVRAFGRLAAMIDPVSLESEE